MENSERCTASECFGIRKSEHLPSSASRLVRPSGCRDMPPSRLDLGQEVMPFWVRRLVERSTCHHFAAVDLLFEMACAPQRREDLDRVSMASVSSRIRELCDTAIPPSDGMRYSGNPRPSLLITGSELSHRPFNRHPPEWQSQQSAKSVSSATQDSILQTSHRCHTPASSLQRDVWRLRELTAVPG